MRDYDPFLPDDLYDLGRFYNAATAVVPMQDIADGLADSRTLGVRHDVDNHIEPAVQMAAWEAERGHRSTYFILHTAPYWQNKPLLTESLEQIAGYGHEIGFHVNAITEAIRTGRDPLEIVAEAVGELRGYGHRVRGVVAHGDAACYENGSVRFVNDELFTESPRPECGTPDRTVAGVKLNPVSRATFGFDYDPNWLPRGDYLSDSGGRWSQPFETVTEAFPARGQLHMLVHPCWWREAFARQEAVA